MNRKKRKRSVNQLFHRRFHNARFFLQSVKDRDWLSMVPVGGELGRPDSDQLAQQDFSDVRSNLSSLIDKCRASCESSNAPSDATERKHAVNVQIALHELGQDVSVAVAAAVWRHYSNSLMACWMSGAETVAAAKRTLFAYCTRKPIDWDHFLSPN